ncbi:adenosine deaminase family protein [Conexibacter arvalis]|uniref:adenosine deaminase n=1 Tax=Conexibacter arvalis TaxID=912552 RepID=A0A840IE67_9ACTN|nr:adenosine deaminase [Conexibacter arvalis]MBB4663096.1 adenosine deaminase [Conexibacter arvalis]
MPAPATGPARRAAAPLPHVRRQRALAALLVTALALFAALLAAATTASPARADEAGAARALERFRDRPAQLNPFLRALPKGADLHMHLSGAIYAEDLLRFGARDGSCADTVTFVASVAPCGPGQRPLTDAYADNGFQTQLMNAWSLKSFPPGMPGHDHFFATFGKFGATLNTSYGEGLATVARRARSQNIQYLEVLTTPRSGDTRALSEAVQFTRDLPRLRERMLAAGLRDILPRARAELDALVAQEARFDPAPDPLVRYSVQISRATPPARVFAQLLLAFELMADDPRWVSLNLVQPEDDVVALRDYRLHMRMIRYLRGLYPKGHVTLHAGELVPGLAPPADLRFHIRAAVEVAGAERIGHGVGIRWERDPVGLARRMARRDVLVEVPLTSNAQILGVSGRRHPLRFYLRHRVPVALATDDEGVSRTDLTEQYEQAVRDHGLGYRALKRMAIDSLRHSFAAPATKRRLLREQARRFKAFEARYER